MARKNKDWKAEWEKTAAEARKLAKRANQRMVRLERYQARPEFKNILEYSYKSAQKYIQNTFGPSKSGKGRYKEYQKLYDIDAAQTKEEQYRYNVYILRERIRSMQSFLEATSSTIRDVGEKKGLKRVIEEMNSKRTQTINDKIRRLYGIDANLTDNDLKRFFESKKQAKLAQLVGSDQMFVVAATIKKFNLKSNKRDMEKFFKSNIDMKKAEEAGITRADLEGKSYKSYKDMINKLGDFVSFTGDEILDTYVQEALKEGINVKNIFI